MSIFIIYYSIFNSEKAVLAVTLNNEKEDVLAHAAFFDYPNIPCVDSAEWQHWLTSNFEYDKCTVSFLSIIHVYFVNFTLKCFLIYVWHRVDSNI